MIFSENAAEVGGWELLAADVAQILERIGNLCLRLPVGTLNWAAEGVAARIALRTNELLGATLALIGLNALVASRTLTRSLLECAFASAALTTKPNELVAMLKADSEESRRRQGKFILAQRLGDGELRRDALEELINAIDAKLKTISPKKVAELGPIVKLYLQYQRLSDDSAHLTARSLEHYVAREQGGWTMAAGIPSVLDNAATLRLALQSSLLTGLAICEVLRFSTEHHEVGTLLQRLEAMPLTKVI